MQRFLIYNTSQLRKIVIATKESIQKIRQSKIIENINILI